MAHSHKHHHSPRNGITLAFWLNLIFSIIEIIGGMLTNSTAIISDAFHDFMDALAIGAAVLLEKISGKKRTSTFSYGYRRFSLLSALTMSVFLLVGAVLMIGTAYDSFLSPKVVDSKGMLWLAVLGILINGFAFLRIKKSDGHAHGHAHHHHGHGHSHDHNSRAIMLHLLEDVLGWVAVLIGAVVIYYTGWYWIDGLLTLAIAGFIGYNASKNLISTMKIVLQSVPENVNLQQLHLELKSIDGIEDIHDLHVWSIDGSYNIGSLHAVVDPNGKHAKADVLLSIVKLMEKHTIQHPTVQLEERTGNCKLIAC
ncbi:cation diffusion facilitator family transporter [Sphingobacterium sp. NGMCC 1.201703]|uniref:cation diffusion facilitator family transporter n=1 Tax=unclassified Sphingobacterium TaxID=2609468 RepID=UPI001C379587|nr:cation diffusion facilitator family transporter [Sphingobacterium sp. CZ-UAM]